MADTPIAHRPSPIARPWAMDQGLWGPTGRGDPPIAAQRLTVQATLHV